MYQTDRFRRDINLVDYAIKHGYRPVEREGTDAVTVLRHPNTEHIIGVSRDPSGHWRYDTITESPGVHDPRTYGEIEKGDIIDFARHRIGWESCSYSERLELQARVADELRTTPLHHHHIKAPQPPAKPLADAQRRSIDEYLRTRFAGRSNTPDADNGYLDKYGIRPESLQDPRFSHACKESAFGGCAFVQRDAHGIAGVETYPPLSKSQLELAGLTHAPASHGVWHSAPMPTDNRLVITETPLCALSYYQLALNDQQARARVDSLDYVTPRDHAVARSDPQRTRYISAGVDPSPHKLALLDQAVAKMPPGSIVIVAVGRDPTLEPLAAKLMETVRRHSHVTPARHAPDRDRGDDWNAAMRYLQRQQLDLSPAMALRKGLDR